MNRYLTFSLAVFMTLSTLAIPPRAAKKPRAGTDSQKAMVWTNDDLASLHLPGLICIVGRTNEENAKVCICAGTVRGDPESSVVCRAGGETTR